MRYLDSIKERLSVLLPMWLLIMLVAIWSVIIQDGDINRDGLLYLKQAYLMAEGSWKEGLALYPWPFFSILIAIFHKISGLHLQAVAHAVDLALFGIATLFYLKTLQLISKDKQIVFYGGVILLSFISIMDDYVGMVLRDHGLWAGCMMGSYFYFRSLELNTLKNSIFWQTGFIFAGLFRPEGLVFLVLLPMWNCFYRKTIIIKELLTDYGILISLFVLASFVFLFSNFDFLNILNSSRLFEIVLRLLDFFSKLFTSLPINTNNFFLNNLIQNNGLEITFGVLFSILFFKWIQCLGFLHGALFFYSLLKKNKNFYKTHLYFFLIISFLIVFSSLVNNYVLSNRYWIFHCFWIFVLISQTLSSIFEKSNLKLLYKIIIFILIVILIANSLIDSPINYEKDVAIYIRSNQIDSIDYNGQNRIKYYVKNDIGLIDFNNVTDDIYKYKLIKINSSNNLYTGRVIKSFPEFEPKFIILKNDK